MPENNQMMSVEGQLVGMPLAGPESFSQQQLDYLKRALGVDETVLFSGTAYGQNPIQLSESLLNFERVKIWMRSNADASNPVSIVEYPTSRITDQLVIFLTDRFSTAWQWITWRFNYSITNSGTTLTETSSAHGGSNASSAWSANVNVHTQEIYKIVGIHRIAGGNQ